MGCLVEHVRAFQLHGGVVWGRYRSLCDDCHLAGNHDPAPAPLQNVPGTENVLTVHFLERHAVGLGEIADLLSFSQHQHIVVSIKTYRTSSSPPDI
jgi:hypothetical protein